jgi:uncharacterized protein
MSSLFPIVSAALPPAAEFVPVLAIGVLFGVALEVAGFGHSRVLASQFYFHDMRVFKVMFTAIVTAAAGVSILSGVGLLDMSLVYVPDTFIVPLMAGGFILGMGFMLSAYCPGTSIVGAASGKWDGLFTFAGVIAGSVLFGALQPYVEGFYMSTARGVFTLPMLLGVSFPVLVAVIACAAFLLFLGADRLEAVFARKLAMPEGDKLTGAARKGLVTLTSLAVLAVVFPALAPAGRPAANAGGIGSITPVKLGRMIVEDPRSLYLVDVREAKACPGTESIPGAVCFREVKDSLPLMYSGKTLVAFSQSGKELLPADLFKYTGRIIQLQGGYDAWRIVVIGKPEPAYQAYLNATNDTEKILTAAIHAYFTGAKAEAPVDSVKPGVVFAQPKKRSGGCS